MFRVGEIVVYGVKGVYRIENIGTPEIDWLDSSKEYYTLMPVYREEKVFIPVDADVYIRPIISREEADNFILSIPSISADETSSRNPRSLEASYQEAFNKHELNELVKIIKKTYSKRARALKSGKKLAQIDERYMRRAENLLFEELAASLDIEKTAVPEYIRKMLNEY